MKERRRFGGPAAATLGAFLSAQLGCARLYTFSPESAARHHDSAWTILATPESEASTAPLTPVEPIVPFRDRPEVADALRSPRDEFGVPTTLYALDPLLGAYRREVAARTASSRATANSLFILTTALVGASAVCWWAGPYSAARSTDPSQASARRFLFFSWASILDVSALFYLAAGISIRSEVGDPTALHRYFHETYDEPRAAR